MGTLVSVSLAANNSDEIQKSFELIHNVELSLSSYAPQADIYRLNMKKEIDASPYTLEAIRLSQQYYKDTDGYFDITVGSITKKGYRFGENEKIPDKQELDNYRLNIKDIKIQNSKITIAQDINIDLGGMGKGYTVDQVVKYLQSKNIDKGVIAASGDIRCLDLCKIEIQNPFDESIIGSFLTKKQNTAVSTSGNYRRFVKSKENNHLIDPKSRRPQKKFASVTLISQHLNSTLDAYATAVSVMPLEKALHFLDDREINYILITNDKQVFFSKGLKDAVTNFQFSSL